MSLARGRCTQYLVAIKKNVSFYKTCLLFLCSRCHRLLSFGRGPLMRRPPRCRHGDLVDHVRLLESFPVFMTVSGTMLLALVGLKHQSSMHATPKAQRTMLSTTWHVGVIFGQREIAGSRTCVNFWERSCTVFLFVIILLVFLYFIKVLSIVLWNWVILLTNNW